MTTPTATDPLAKLADVYRRGPEARAVQHVDAPPTNPNDPLVKLADVYARSREARGTKRAATTTQLREPEVATDPLSRLAATYAKPGRDAPESHARAAAPAGPQTDEWGVVIESDAGEDEPAPDAAPRDKPPADPMQRLADVYARNREQSAEAEPESQDAPASYDFKAPDGQPFDPEVIAAYAKVASELKLPQAQAQQLLDKVAPVMRQRQQQVLEAARAEWKQAARDDAEVGKDGFVTSVSIARRTLDRLGTPALRQLLHETGLGDHPEMLRLLRRVGIEIGVPKFPLPRARL